jgi:hypothetical protein
MRLLRLSPVRVAGGPLGAGDPAYGRHVGGASGELLGEVLGEVSG